MILKNFKAKYVKGDVELRIGRYNNAHGPLALLLHDPESGERLCLATVNIPEIMLPLGHTFIKGWSENEGIPEALLAAGIITEPEESWLKTPFQVSPWVEVRMYRLALTTEQISKLPQA
jgi:hypothetical protein